MSRNLRAVVVKGLIETGLYRKFIFLFTTRKGKVMKIFKKAATILQHCSPGPIALLPRTSRQRSAGLVPILFLLQTFFTTSSGSNPQSFRFSKPSSISTKNTSSCGTATAFCSSSNCPSTFFQSSTINTHRNHPPTTTNSKLNMSTTTTSNRKENNHSSLPQYWSDPHDAIQRCIPHMSSKSHKGSSGRVGVLGGSARYTGAPYYAAMASLKAGADLAFVFCAEEAAIPIKCYSPELMVAPVYTAREFDHALTLQGEFGEEERNRLVEAMVKEVVDLFDRMHVLIIGPGLGRCPLVQRATVQIIYRAKKNKLPLVIDADGLFLLTQPLLRNILFGYDRAILTPNVMEMRRLMNKENNESRHSSLIPEALHRNVLVQKGKQDVISTFFEVVEEDDNTYNEVFVMTCKEEGGLKRSGGIGDVLAGIVGTFVAWHDILRNNEHEHDPIEYKKDLLLSCWSACCVTKRATKAAFDKKRRSMTAPDILDEIGEVFDIMTRNAEDDENYSVSTKSTNTKSTYLS